MQPASTAQTLVADSIQFNSVTKTYSLEKHPATRLLQLLDLKRPAPDKVFHALQAVTFGVAKGESLSLIGRNGSGKSTLLGVVAGIIVPSAGTAATSGRVSALLELGSGFNPEFTGRHNVELQCALLGYPEREIEAKMPLIEAFADIGAFFDQPLKTYSSGMTMRLAFAAAIHVDPEILIIDEALAVGDAAFRSRCIARLQDFQRRGVTVLFVSHSMAEVQAVCNRVLWLEHGRVKELGDAGHVIARFLSHEDAQDGHEPEYVAYNQLKRNGDGSASLKRIRLTDVQGREIRLLHPNQPLRVDIHVVAERELRKPVIGFHVQNHLGLDFFTIDTSRETMQLPALGAGESITIEFEVDVPEIYHGDVSFTPYVLDVATGTDTLCDEVPHWLTLEVARTEAPVYGYLHVPATVTVNRTLPLV